MQLITPFTQGFCLALVGDANRCALITGLLLLMYPLAVFWGIAFFIINAFDGVEMGRAFAHICKKVFKLGPSPTDCNPAFPIIGERSGVRVIAPVTHPRPYLKFGRFGQTVFQPWVAVGVLNALAATRNRITADEIAGGDLGCVAAITEAAPERLFLTLISQIAENRQLPVSKISTVYETKGIRNGQKLNVRIRAGHGIFSFVENSVIRPVREVNSRVRAVLILPRIVPQI